MSSIICWFAMISRVGSLEPSFRGSCLAFMVPVFKSVPPEAQHVPMTALHGGVSVPEALATSAQYWLFSPQGIDYSHA